MIDLAANQSADPFTLRPIMAEDLPAVLVLTRLVPGAPWWSEAHVQQIIGHETSPDAQFRRGWVIAADAATRGFLVLQGLRFRDGAGTEIECEIESIVVDPDHRRQGLGHALLAAALGWCREQRVALIRLEVRSQNRPALSLYRLAGFGAVGTRPNYYRSPADDAVLMELRLTSSEAPVRPSPKF